MKKQKANKLILGLTGSFGSGKTTVAGILESYGAKIIDADKIAHQVIKPGGPAYNKIARAFGARVLDEDKSINRHLLAQIVFNHHNLLVKLNSIVHPEVIRVIKDELKRAKASVVVIDAPLLIETGLDKLTHKLIVVKINKLEQLRRLQEKLGLSKRDIQLRINCQLPLEEKVRRADFVIDNNKTILETKKQVTQIRRKLWRS
ncbi:MAG: dephospho-CoA kinase [Candidatus Omnitrophota bacterium]